MAAHGFVGRLRAPRARAGGASVLDLAGALALTVVAVVSMTHDGHGLPPAAAVALATMPVAWRRRAPVTCAIAFVVGVGLSAVATPDAIRCGAVFPAGLLLAYSVGVRRQDALAVMGLGFVLAGQLVESASDARVSVTDFPFIALLTLGAWGGGRVVRSRTRVAHALADRTQTLERQREETAQLAVDVEKLRIAADLDLVARARVATMIDLAAGGERAAGSNRPAAREAFASIEHAGRQSLNEMRALLGVLRNDEPGTRAPRPTLAQTEGLLAQARAGGRVVRFDLEGDARPLPDEIDVSGYRILQHLLTASLMAGTSGPVSVRLRYTPDGVLLEVTGDADADDRHDVLAAARERTSVHGGTFTIGFPSTGRRLLRAHLPVATGHA